MAKGISEKLPLWLNAALLSLSLPLLLNSSVRAQQCTQVGIYTQIQQFKNVKALTSASDAVVKCGEDAVPSLAEALSNSDAAIRTHAASALGKMGWSAQDAVSDLVETLGDGDEAVRSSSVRALIDIGRSAQQRANRISELDLQQIAKLEILKQQIEKALTRLDAKPQAWANLKLQQQELRLTRNALQTKLNQLQDRIIYRGIQWVIKNPGIFALLAGAGYLGIFAIRPLWLLSLDKILPQTYKIPGIGLEVPLQKLLIFKHSPKVLDAWVEKYFESVKIEFLDKDIVKRDRTTHLPQPVFFNNQTLFPDQVNDENPTAEHTKLQNALKAQMLREQQFCVLIQGEGGAGKTSLACQIANWGMEGKLSKHRMLPILIDRELQENENFLEMIRKQLQDLTNTENEEISPEYLKNLLRQRRVLVIVDHFSEMEKSTCNKILAALTENPIINALVFTSRLEGELRGLTKCILQPMRVEGERISEFLGEYLKLYKCRNLFDDEEFYNACSRLNRMVGQRNITIMLAKLYADQMIAAKQGNTELPENIPELMLSYLNKLHPQADAAKQLAVHREVEIIAWKCLENTYRPAPILRKTAETALVEIDPNETNTRLNYLQATLNLLQKVEPDKVRINLDPLAEYLAGLYLVQQHQDNAETWEKLLKDIGEKTENLKEIKGFLLALWDCCEFKKKELNIPDSVIEQLLKKANLDPEEIKKAQRKERIKNLIKELSAPEPEYRTRAVNDLRTMGKDATPAIPRLRKLLENNSEVFKIRREAAIALKQLGEEIPMLIAEIKNGLESIQLVEHPPTENIDLGNEVILEMVEIPGGSFLMGAPPEEKGSNDRENDREQPQHKVTVAPFLMGKYPVTQAQWQAVVALPQVERALNPDISQFKGAERPVESVSWYDAVEFCARLSQHTGREFRLPSEAEWEYGCRAGTTTPFHFGETISTNLANHLGETPYRETTPVGMFQVANAFGLCEMHGLVLELCADSWHENYEGAPSDGSVWIDKNDKPNGCGLVRGGSWFTNRWYCRSAVRNSYLYNIGNNDNGFRVACSAARTS
ncbi:hypothetical protein Cylst_2129 [Cylindrospermum stagnale PCC 7417]|uniref:Sulfatase-modifying factor enzyme domain-containing protein n=1 Tax=Cylindrospermum stagnale PCC 7417 TaxID=56107 RepID=K9WXX1_9NOST|nr:SUMF1/EgtB/PvdO family nonheme iron enzyme [Cylindrospermum stagnale]AFZ24367.1 hypothetical protein Cylst_2129 [Cylindrospermum stagnale PCC 7417]